MKLSYVTVLTFLVVILPGSVGCGPKVFPKCGEPGVECPPCPESGSWPDPCVSAKRDGGASTRVDAGPEAGK